MSDTQDTTPAQPHRIQVLVVEDEPEFLERFSEAIRSDATLRLMDAVPTGKEACTLLARQRPDVMLVDLGLPDMSGLEVIRRAQCYYPNMDILVVTMFGDDDHVLSSIEAGATGYLLKDASSLSIREAIRELHEGGSPISPSIARRVLGRFRATLPVEPPPPTQTAPAPIEERVLSERELEILRLISKGLSVKESGLTLGISPHTVSAHLKKTYQKLAVNSRSEAVYEAMQMGWL